MRKFRTILAAFIVIAALVSCEDDTQNETINGGNNSETVVPSDPGNNGDEENNEDGDGNEGEGDNEEEVVPTPTPTNGETVAVDTIEVIANIGEIPYTGGTIEFVTMTNVGYSVSTNQAWITITSDGRALTSEYTVTATIEANDSQETREGVITVTFQDEAATVKTVTINQAAKPEPEPEPEPEYIVDSHGYATYTYNGFSFKMKESEIETRKGKEAIEHMKADLDHIVSIIPEEALTVMRKKPIWMEKNNTHNSSAAWYHTWAGYPASIGDLSEKGKCVEITNFSYYVSWSNQNQPLMVLHELCHLYHDQGLGGEGNQTIKQAYQNAKSSGIYNEGWYRSNTNYTNQNQWVKTTDMYCMVTVWEYFSELSEAYWGENDYYPFNYEQLKEHDPVGFAMMESIWGPK